MVKSSIFHEDSTVWYLYNTLGHLQIQCFLNKHCANWNFPLFFPSPLPSLLLSLSLSSFLYFFLFSLPFFLPPCASSSHIFFISMNFLFIFWLYRDFYFKIQWLWDSPSDPVVGSLPSSSRVESSIPDQATKIPHTTGQLSLWSN